MVSMIYAVEQEATWVDAHFSTGEAEMSTMSGNLATFSLRAKAIEDSAKENMIPWFDEWAIKGRCDTLAGQMSDVSGRPNCLDVDNYGNPNLPGTLGAKEDLGPVGTPEQERPTDAFIADVVTNAQGVASGIGFTSLAVIGAVASIVALWFVLKDRGTL